jgi:polyisoprenyl-phosphate glycosyltransferase
VLPRETPVLLSIVIPVYNEDQVLPLLRAQLTTLVGELLCPVEVILVDDGSADQSYAYLRSWALEDPAIKVIALSRNFGHQLAITAGMDASSGDAVVIMDADLQDPPALIPEMIRSYCEGYDVVYGQRTERDGETWFKRASAAMFYAMMRRFVDPRLPANTGDFRLVSRRVIEALRRVREHDRFVRGIVAWLGFPQKALPYRRAGRAAGTTKYPLAKMLRLALDAMVSCSDLPLVMIRRVGMLATLASLVVLVRTGVLYFTDPARPSLAFAGLAGLIGLFGGATLIAIGVVGIYVAKIFTEARGRPLYLVRDAVNVAPEPP